MARSMTSVPFKLLHEGEGHPVTVELKTGELYRGRLTDSDEFMNCHMRGVTHTAVDGHVTRLEQVFLRGSQVRLIVLPSILQSAPMFRKVAEAASTKSKPKA